jgi:hypothetical protein
MWLGAPFVICTFDGPNGPTSFTPFINMDKNKATLRREAAGNKLRAAIIPSLPPGAEIFFDKDSGIMSHAWQPLVKIDWADIDGPQPLQWRPAKVQGLNLDTVAITERFKTSFSNKKKGVVGFSKCLLLVGGGAAI